MWNCNGMEVTCIKCVVTHGAEFSLQQFISRLNIDDLRTEEEKLFRPFKEDLNSPTYVKIQFEMFK